MAEQSMSSFDFVGLEALGSGWMKRLVHQAAMMTPNTFVKTCIKIPKHTIYQWSPYAMNTKLKFHPISSLTIGILGLK
jgi:hypothetical protein